MVFLDLLMPGIGGEKILRELKRTNPDLPVVILTGKLVINKKDLRKLGAFYVIKKPFHLDELMKIIKMVPEKNISIKEQHEKQK